MRTLSDILAFTPVSVHGAAPVEINQIRYDSRAVAPGDLFVAVRGSAVDGHLYIEKAIEMGAAVIVCEQLPEAIQGNVHYIVTDDSAKALGLMASAYYGNPSKKLKLVGITGTNGKTTTVTLLYQLFRKLGYKAGLISTIRNFIDHHEVASTHTTPDPVQLNRLLADMVSVGCEYCFMEVSSHAIHQQRIAGVSYCGAIFSNITQDHLDYHKTFKDYIQAKKLFFDHLPKQSFALINTDDRNGRVMVQNSKAEVHSYALNSMADFKVRIQESHLNGMLLTINNMDVWVNFIGNFNAYNVLAVYATAVLLKQKPGEVLEALSVLMPVDGRFQCITSPEGKLAVVDYAHTPDAVDNVLSTLQEFRTGNRQIITVIGAGGDRDKTKRPLMAQAAVKQSDKVILTSDNPRSENPETIIEEMKAGVLPPYNRKLLSITNREEAIRTACMLAAPGDIVLIAGKGHETYQEIKGVRHHFDDREVVKEIFGFDQNNQ